MKWNNLHNKHRKFQVQQQNYVWIRSKNKYRKVVTNPSTTKFDRLKKKKKNAGDFKCTMPPAL